MVTLHTSGKPASEIIKEYDLTPSTFHKWVKQFSNSGSFKEKDNLSPDQIELAKLEKEQYLINPREKRISSNGIPL